MARAVWPERARRLRARVRRSRHVLASALLVIAGLAGMLGGAALVGTWCLGLVHLGQEELTAAVRGAQQRKLAGAQAWERRGPAADQSPLVAVTLAVWALLDWESGSDPGAWVVDLAERADLG